MSDRGIDMRLDAARATPESLPASGAGWVRPLLELLSPRGARGRLTILIFHRVHPQPDPMFPGEMHAASFRERMGWIREWFNVLPLEDAVAALSRGKLPRRALAITFDDGYADNSTVALPILRELGLPATFFIATGFLDGGRMWNDTVIETIRATQSPELDLSRLGLGVHRVDSPAARAAAAGKILPQLKYLSPPERQRQVDAVAAIAPTPLPANLMLTGEQVRGLAAAGMGIGGHTVTHPILARLDDGAARREIADGRDVLESMVGRPVKLFAYPNGKPGSDYVAAHAQMVKDLGFSAAVSTAGGAARAGDSPFELPRFTPWDRTPGRWGWRLMRNLYAATERVTP